MRHSGHTSRLLKNSRRSRCLRHGPGCKASRRRRCPSASSRSDNIAVGAVPRQPIRAQGVGGHLLCCGSSTMAPHRPPRRASHMAPQASCARPMRVFQQPASRDLRRKCNSAFRKCNTKLRSRMHSIVGEDTYPRQAGMCIPACDKIGMDHRLNATGCNHFSTFTNIEKSAGSLSVTEGSRARVSASQKRKRFRAYP